MLHKRSLIAAFAIALTMFAGQVSADVINGGFESGTGADADNWNQLEINGGSATAVADRNSSMANSGGFAMFFDVRGEPGFGPVAEIQQQTAVGSVVGGQAYDFSFFAKGTDDGGSVGFYEVSWFDGDGSDGGGVRGSATGLQTYALSNNYEANSMTALVAPNDADSVFVQIRLVTGAFDGAGGTAFIDDVVFTTAVPEPS